MRDLAVDPVPHLDAGRFAAFLAKPEERTGEQQAVVSYSDALIDELKRADIVVLGLPLYNFGVPSALKAYFDHIGRAGATFRYTEKGPVGMLTGKKVYVFAARGGFYAGTPNDTQTPYIRAFLSFIGMSDIEFVYAEGLAISEASKQASLSKAAGAIADTERLRAPRRLISGGRARRACRSGRRAAARRAATKCAARSAPAAKFCRDVARCVSSMRSPAPAKMTVCSPTTSPPRSDAKPIVPGLRSPVGLRASRPRSSASVDAGAARGGFAERERGARRRVDLVPVVHLDDLDVVGGAEAAAPPTRPATASTMTPTLMFGASTSGIVAREGGDRGLLRASESPVVPMTAPTRGARRPRSARACPRVA